MELIFKGRLKELVDGSGPGYSYGSGHGYGLIFNNNINENFKRAGAEVLLK